VISGCERRWNRPGWPDLGRRILGVATLVLLVVASGGAASLVEAAFRGVAGQWGWIVVALVAWPALAQRSLLEHYRPVEAALRLAGPVRYDDMVADKAWIGEGGHSRCRCHAPRPDSVYPGLRAGLDLGGRNTMAAVMLQGTGSDVGKSVLVAGLCRALANRGLRVMPFKPQNMSNNAAVTIDGGEIGRAQALQALAARAQPHTDMNPVLLKPQADRTSQLIVHGQVRGTLGSANFREGRRGLLPAVLASWERLQSRCDIVVVEGAGSPAEINLRDGDIANMGFARAAKVPVVLVGDIDRGGVIASLVGTRAVLEDEDAAMIRGFIVNKFRGDPALFVDGYAAIEQRTGWRGFGLVPWLGAVARLPSEDAVILERVPRANSGRVLIACPMLPRIANFDDLDPLKAERDVELVMVPPGTPLPADAALIVLPGSKATIADMAFVREQGWDIDILAHHRRGGAVLGICAGYQMLGRTIADPSGIEGPPSKIAGLGLLAGETVLGDRKTLRQVTGTALAEVFAGYEMHMGATELPAGTQPFAMLDGDRADGAISADGRVMGTYCHGLLASGGLRRALLGRIGARSDAADHSLIVEAALDELAQELERHLDIDGLIAVAAEAGA
jgi:adenosylcobyric acid synthase